MSILYDRLNEWAQEHRPDLAKLLGKSNPTSRMRLLAAVFIARVECDNGIWLFDLMEEGEAGELIDLMLVQRKDGRSVALWMNGHNGYPPDGMSVGTWIGALQASSGMRRFGVELPDLPKGIRPVPPDPEPAAVAPAKSAGLFGGAK